MIRIGMIGGGEGAFIGAVHRIALNMDGDFRLVAGAFSRDAENCARTGASLGLDADRCYPSWQAMIDGERARPEGDRIEAVAIVTPNHVHHGPAKAAMEAGFHVICDKPLGVDLDEGRELAAVREATERVFVLTHNYLGYPMVREARERVRAGALGKIRKVHVEYLQGWLSDPLEETGQKQADWRTDPARSGPVGALGDIGTHAFNLLEHVTGLRVNELYARLETFVEGRRLDDDDTVLLKLDGGATGTLLSSQICYGRENGLALRVYGTAGGFHWRQEHPNDLEWIQTDGSVKVIRPGTPAAGEAAGVLTRTPAGHPEGYLEGFANVYRAAARAIRGEADLEAPYTTVEEGVRGLAFITACLESSKDERWVSLPES